MTTRRTPIARALPHATLLLALPLASPLVGCAANQLRAEHYKSRAITHSAQPGDGSVIAKQDTLPSIRTVSTDRATAQARR